MLLERSYPVTVEIPRVNGPEALSYGVLAHRASVVLLIIGEESLEVIQVNVAASSGDLWM